MIGLAKAFVSVSHEALCMILAAKCIPIGMINYILETYMCIFTRFQYGDWESDPVNITCRLKQGDPLSSHFLNFLDIVMLRFVPIEIAVNIDGAKENVISFADDTVLLATSKTGLQELIN